MVVHTFSPTNEWFENYQALFGLKNGVDQAKTVALFSDINFHFACDPDNDLKSYLLFLLK